MKMTKQNVHVTIRNANINVDKIANQTVKKCYEDHLGDLEKLNDRDLLTEDEFNYYRGALDALFSLDINEE